MASIETCGTPPEARTLRAAIAALLVAAPFAGQAANPAAPAADVLEDVVVTAQRRQASVQDVSASVTVLNADALQAAGIFDTQALETVVPGLVVSRDIGLSTQVFIRGIGNNLLGIGSGNSVATYVDGVYLANSVQVFQNFMDSARVEVLKGPQAVLYGRNATGGAILVHSKAPSFSPEASADVSVGNYSHVQARAMATGPLIEGTLAGRLSVQYSDRDGYSRSLTSGRGQDFETIRAVRAALLFTPTESLQVTVAADYADTDGGDFKKGVNLNGWMYQLSSPNQFSPDPRGRFQQFDSSQPTEDWGMRASVEWESPLGTVQSVTSYRDFRVGPVFFDNDSIGVPMTIGGTPFQISFNGNVIASEQIYHETFLATPDDRRLTAILGFNYFDESSSDFSNRFVGPALARNQREFEADAYSAYLDVGFAITERLKAVFGARYSKENKEYSQQGLNATTNAPLAFARNESDWSQTTPRFGLEYRPGDRTLLYAMATNGFKSGGFNEANPLNRFDPEEVWAYEVGAKHSWNANVRTNVSVFYYDYEDLQVQQIIIPSFTRLIRNAASARIAGADFEFAARLTPNATVGANASYLDTEYGDFEICIDLLGPCTIATPGGTVLNPVSNVNVRGNQMANAPELSGFFYADYTIDAFLGGSLKLHGDASYRSDMYFSPFEAPIHRSDAFWLLGAELRYTAPGERWFVAAFGRNLTDELYETWIANVSRFLGPGDGAPRYVSWGPPRTYGLRVGVSF